MNFNKSTNETSNKKFIKYDTKAINDYVNNYKKDFDPNDISGMTINGQTFNIKNITGYSKEIIKLTGHLKTLKSTSEEIKIPEIYTEPFDIKTLSDPDFSLSTFTT